MNGQDKTNDIKELKLALSMFRESERKYRAFFANVNDAILRMEKDVFVNCNRKLLKKFRCSRELVTGQITYRFSPPLQPDGQNSKEKSTEKVKGALTGVPQFFEWKHYRTKTPVNKLEVLKGTKIRATGLASKIVTALGEAPVSTSMHETYDVLHTGVAQSAFAPFEALQGFKCGEVVSSSTVAYGSGYSTGMFMVINKNKWNSLPPDVQTVFHEVNEEWIEKQAKAWDEIEQEEIEFTKKSGNRIIYLSKEVDA